MYTDALKNPLNCLFIIYLLIFLIYLLLVVCVHAHTHMWAKSQYVSGGYKQLASVTSLYPVNPWD